MGTIESQITSLTIICSILYWDADQRKHQSSASLAFVRRIHRGPVNSQHKWPVTRKMFPFDDVIMDIMKAMEVLQWQASKFNEVMFSPLTLPRGIEAIQDLISHGVEFPWQEVENYAGISMLHKDASFLGLATKYLRFPGGRFATIIIVWWKINDVYIYSYIYINTMIWI